ncbi:hypothetical protein H4696_007039 [Amycolatopsis lexingtonensis]|uniref:Uncharacterized protein n=1 Tax=Amycolatopsis lexingtonensis TaxID=218822 RepID=A0ABR9I9U2_9PSEU|nr:hypothetical protein [Amycolatopsis lexingtonensis]MBE1499939.1 hypothetical protein [Amycolatopsis lexingtonensis]
MRVVRVTAQDMAPRAPRARTVTSRSVVGADQLTSSVPMSKVDVAGPMFSFPGVRNTCMVASAVG